MVREYMKEIGYNDKDIEKIINFYINNTYLDESLYIKVRDIFNYFLQLGIKKEDIISITRRYPSIYSYSIDTLEKKNKMFFDFGLSREEFVKQIRIMPFIYGLSEENIKIKKAFYEKIGIFDLVINNPRNLLCSIDMVYARYMFYRTIGIKINRINYRMLFVKERTFVSKYGKNNKTLIELYNFNDFINKKKVRSKENK